MVEATAPVSIVSRGSGGSCLTAGFSGGREPARGESEQGKGTMTVVAERRTRAEGGRYEVRYEETGQVLGYVTVTRGAEDQPLGRALEQNGFRLVPSESQASRGPRAELLR